MVINLSLEDKIKAIRIGDQAQVEAETRLFDPTHHVENVGVVPLSGDIAVPPQSITLFIVQFSSEEEWIARHSDA